MPTERMSCVTGSRIIALNDEVVRMKQAGADIVSLTLGEPDFDTPAFVIDAAVDAMRKGDTHYTASKGIAPLRKLIASTYSSRNGIPCKMENVLVATAKMALYEAMVALLDAGDEILVPDPGWVSYEQMARLVDAVPVAYDLGEGFHVDIDALNEVITPRSAAIVINSPSNPTGAVFTRNEMRAIAEVAEDNDLLVISDEVYDRLVFEGEHVSIASLPGMFDRTVTIFSCSKTYAMSGWRIGWAIAPADHIIQMGKVHENSVTCMPGFIQAGTIAAIEGGEEALKGMLSVYRERRGIVVDGLNAIPGLECHVPEGTFYAFPRFDAEIDSFEVASLLLREGHVAITPGEAFGKNSCRNFRLSFAASERNIKEGIARISKVMKALA
ncbi:MAG: pyridoxal phosphate-dependent aminotransferase [Thermoplasmata archaeon]|nr:pyridoxal phosphate-dependent aminotransferase [Thermoplasmata archaeon]